MLKTSRSFNLWLTFVLAVFFAVPGKAAAQSAGFEFEFDVLAPLSEGKVDDYHVLTNLSGKWEVDLYYTTGYHPDTHLFEDNRDHVEFEIEGGRMTITCGWIPKVVHYDFIVSHVSRSGFILVTTGRAEPVTIKGRFLGFGGLRLRFSEAQCRKGRLEGHRYVFMRAS